MSSKVTKRVCDVQQGDEKWVEELEHEIWMLTGMVEEAFVTNPTYLLSPVMREMLRDKARSVAEKMRLVKSRLVVDNLGPKNLYGVEP